MDFLHEMRYRNPFNHIILILDNFFAHRTENVAITAEIGINQRNWLICSG